MSPVNPSDASTSRSLGRRARRLAATARWRIWSPLAAAFQRRAVQWLSSWPLRWRSPPPAPAGGPARIAYYVRRFPVLSQTFIQREVAELLELGIPLEVIAEGVSGAAHFDADARRLAERTLYVGRWEGDERAEIRALFRRRPWTVINLYLYVRFHADRARKSARSDRTVWRRAIRLAAVLRERGVTHVHAPSATTQALIALLAARLAGIRYTVQARASDLYARSWQPGLGERLGHADFVITNAQYNVDAIRSRMPARGARAVHVIYEGVDPRRLSVPARAPRDGRAARIVSVARIIEPKGLEVLLRACRILRDQGCAFRCDVIGGREAAETNYYVTVRKLWRALGLEDQVLFLGTRSFDEVRESYAAADVCVLAAVPAADGRRDVTPNTLIEAMAFGLPIVSTRSGAIAELIEDGVSGILVPPRDEKALAEAIARLLDDEELAAALGGAARRRVEERFDVTKNVREYARLFGFPRGDGR